MRAIAAQLAPDVPDALPPGQGPLPSSHPSSVDTNVTETGWKSAGTDPIVAGPAGVEEGDADGATEEGAVDGAIVAMAPELEALAVGPPTFGPVPPVTVGPGASGLEIRAATP